jgi:hypothetical protein
LAVVVVGVEEAQEVQEEPARLDRFLLLVAAVAGGTTTVHHLRHPQAGAAAAGRAATAVAATELAAAEWARVALVLVAEELLAVPGEAPEEGMTETIQSQVVGLAFMVFVVEVVAVDRPVQQTTVAVERQAAEMPTGMQPVRRAPQTLEEAAVELVALLRAVLAAPALSVSGGLNKETTCNTHSSKTIWLKTSLRVIRLGLVLLRLTGKLLSTSPT